MTIVAVIIPYYQKTPGILRRALNSVLGQQLSSGVSVDIIITDDGSPATPEPEIDTLKIEPPFRLYLTRQPNSGAATARNTCLSLLNPNTTYIAFLDSDDIWEPTHLASAISTLDLGYDYYFCDNRRVGAHQSYFAQTHFDAYVRTHGKALDGAVRYSICGQHFFSFSLRAWTSLTPTVVYRRSIAPDLSFDISLKEAGEDCLFLMEVISRTPNVCCSTDVNVTCAEGVNVFYSRYGWDDPGHLTRQMGQLVRLYRYLEILPLSVEDRKYVKSCIDRERRDLAFFSMRSLIRNRFRSIPGFSYMREDTHFWRWYPWHAICVLLLFSLRLYSPSG